MTRLRSALTVVALLVMVGCGSGDATSPLTTAPSGAGGASATSTVTLRFIHDETPLAGGQQIVLAGTVQFTVAGTPTMTVSLQPQTGFTSPRALTLPRNMAIVGQLEFPAWNSLNIGVQPAGRASFTLTPTGTTLETYVVIPVAGPPRLEPCRNGC